MVSGSHLLRGRVLTKEECLFPMNWSACSARNTSTSSDRQFLALFECMHAMPFSFSFASSSSLTLDRSMSHPCMESQNRRLASNKQGAGAALHHHLCLTMWMHFGVGCSSMICSTSSKLASG